MLQGTVSAVARCPGACQIRATACSSIDLPIDEGAPERRLGGADSPSMSVGQNRLADSGLNTSSPQNRRRAAETPEVDKYELQISGFGWLNWVLTHAPSAAAEEMVTRNVDELVAGL